MIYTAKLENGQTLEVYNEGETTGIGFSSGGSSQQQSQSRGFTTGEWAHPPELFRVGNALVLKLCTDPEPKFLRIRGDEINQIEGNPNLEGAEDIPLHKSAQPAFEPMRPMEPMKPMRSMRPMEMRMGNMEMRMGSHEEATSEKKFCTNCGKPLNPSDRYCAGCGAKV